MKNKAISALLLSILLASLLVSCGKGAADGTSSDAAETPAASSQVLEVTSEPTETPPSEETTTEAPVSSEETSTEETSTEAPFVPTPVPEDLPGMDSPAPPEEARSYLPLEGEMYNAVYDYAPQVTYSFTYRGNTMTVEQRDGEGHVIQSDYRFDSRGRLTEFTEQDWHGGTSRTAYTYDAAGRVTSYSRSPEVAAISISYVQGATRIEYVYGEDGALLLETNTFTYADGYEDIHTFEYQQEYDETGALTKLRVQKDDCAYAEHVYEDGREIILRYFYAAGEFYATGELNCLSAYDYDEAGRLTRERYRTTIAPEDAYTDTYFYEGDGLIEVRRDQGEGTQCVKRCVYDAYGRETLCFRNGGYTVNSYAENGELCRMTGYQPNKGYEEFWYTEVTEWGEEATTELQLAFYRTAMNCLFGARFEDTAERYPVVTLPTP